VRFGVVHSWLFERDVGLPGGSRLRSAWVSMNGEKRSSHTRQEIGRTLERARKERGLSLQQVEQATKIRVKYLRDLENENLDVLPAVYMLGSLKTYAAHLGLDGEALAREFKRRQALLQEEHNQAQEEPPASEPRGLIASLSRLLGAESPETAEDDSATVPDPGHSPRLYLSFGVVLIFVLAIALVSTLGAEDQPSVSQVHEPKISRFPAMIALAGNLDDDERNSEAESKESQPENQAKAPPKDEGKDEKDKAEQSGQHEDALQMAQTSSSSATATASPVSTASASATATPASVRPEPAATEDAGDAGEDIAAVAPSGASARAPAGPVVQRKQAGPVNASRLRDRITSRAWNVVEDAW
jgi:cytoskeletal protein RodZ